MESSKPVEDLTYEEALQELEQIVSVLEVEEQTLDGAIAMYERGQQLAEHCAQLLEQAELRVRTLGADDQEVES